MAIDGAAPPRSTAQRRRSYHFHSSRRTTIAQTGLSGARPSLRCPLGRAILIHPEYEVAMNPQSPRPANQPAVTDGTIAPCINHDSAVLGGSSETTAARCRAIPSRLPPSHRECRRLALPPRKDPQRRVHQPEPRYGSSACARGSAKTRADGIRRAAATSSCRDDASCTVLRARCHVPSRPRRRMSTAASSRMITVRTGIA